MGNIIVTIDTTSNEGKTSFPVNTNFWTDLWDQYTAHFQEVVVHSWLEEKEIVDELGKRAVNVMNEGLMKSFTINLSEENRLFFRNHSIDPKGGLKWFTLYFHVNGDEHLEIGQYGSKIILYNVNKERVAEFSTIFPSSTTIDYHDDYED